MEAQRLAEQVRRSYEGGAWHGPSLRELLEGVTAEGAARRPLPAAHSIWELVHHLEVWEREALLTLQEKTYESHSGDQDWPPVAATTAESWQAALERLRSTLSLLWRRLAKSPTTSSRKWLPAASSVTTFCFTASSSTICITPGKSPC